MSGSSSIGPDETCSSPPISLARLERSLTGLPRFLAARSVRDICDVGTTDAEAFIRALSASGITPAIATMHYRRSVLRLLFRFARSSGWASTDPTLDIGLPPRSSLASRPLTSDELAVCRSWSVTTLRETRQPAAWALAESGARTSELPHLVVSDIDLASSRVWLHGSSRVNPRWGHLTGWGEQQLAHRIEALCGEPNRSLVYDGRGGDAAQVSSCVAIASILRRAGLASEPDVRPLSVAAWLGASLHREGAPIEEVARRLGMRSLDRAARLIGWDCQEQAAEDPS